MGLLYKLKPDTTLAQFKKYEYMKCEQAVPPVPMNNMTNKDLLTLFNQSYYPDVKQAADNPELWGADSFK